jgi:AcrR family transcriptional regulator
MRQDVLAKALDDPRSTPARILDAAEEVFAEQGFAAASTREIARRARVPFGALHYHWGSKEQLHQAVMARLVDWIRDTVLRNLLPGGTPGEIIDHLTDAFLDALAARRHAARLLYRHVLEPVDPRVEQMFAQLGSFGEAVLAEHGIAARIDAQALLLVLPNGFLAAVVDEPGQKLALGGSIYSSRAARERLRAELRRIGRAVVGVGS